MKLTIARQKESRLWLKTKKEKKKKLKKSVSCRMQAGLVGWGEAMSSQAVYQVLVKYVPLRDKQKMHNAKKEYS